MKSHHISRNRLTTHRHTLWEKLKWKDTVLTSALLRLSPSPYWGSLPRVRLCPLLWLRAERLDAAFTCCWKHCFRQLWQFSPQSKNTYVFANGCYTFNQNFLSILSMQWNSMQCNTIQYNTRNVMAKHSSTVRQNNLKQNCPEYSWEVE